MRLDKAHMTHCPACARVFGVGCLTLFCGCSAFDLGGPSGPTVPRVTTGSVRVTATTTGADLDPDGYEVMVDGRQVGVVTANGSTTIRGLGLGGHAVQLGQMAPNCVADGANPQVVNVAAPGDIVDVVISVACSAFGSVEIVTVTTGSDPDLNGYQVEAIAVRFSHHVSGAVATNGTVALSGLAAGRYEVRLRGVAGNCGSTEALRRTVDVVSGSAVAVTLNLTCAASTRLAYVAATAAPQGNTDIWVVSSNGTGATPLTDDPARDEDPAWSPDGARIAFTSDRGGSRGVHVMNEDGSGVARLTEPGAPSFQPAWSPDGLRLAFASEREGRADIYVMQADGTSPVRLTNHPARDSDPAWSPDGTRIAFASERDGPSEIYVMNADGSGVERLTRNDTWDGSPHWSPDGTRLAFSRTVCPAWGSYGCYQAVFVAVPTGSSAAAIEVGIGNDPVWSPDGGRIAVTDLVCDYWYSYGCDIVGIGIVGPYPPLQDGVAADPDTWDDLTRGVHSNPVWRPVEP